jgi:amino acid transporter
MAVTAPAELSAAAALIDFWNNDINPAVWYSVFIMIIVVINFCEVKIYGEVSLGTEVVVDLLTVNRVKSSLQSSRSS